MDAARDITPVAPDDARWYAETGHGVSGAFLAFLSHYGLGVCGYPISDAVDEGAIRTQVFQNLALEELPGGRVRVKPLGEAWLAARQTQTSLGGEGVPVPQVVDVVSGLAVHPTRRYAARPLSAIRYVVIHHTGASGEVGVRAIAGEHVHANGWPGIAYHYVVDVDGTIYRTQDLTTVSYHSRQFNPVSVAVALVGDLGTALPPAAQIEGTAALAARLLVDLGLRVEHVRGHREMVSTPCPGETFLGVWKPRLVHAIEAHLRDAPRAPLLDAAVS